MTTTELEQLMLAHKCGFCVFTEGDGYGCEMVDGMDNDVIGKGFGPSIVEAVYEALKSKFGKDVMAPMF